MANSNSNKFKKNHWNFRKCRSSEDFDHNSNKISQKFKWHDGKGRQLTAGGLLPFDENGIWVIGEIKKNGKCEYTDIGGKYKFEDCDIYTTISREFNEEMYHSQTLSRKDILNVRSENPATYVNNHYNQPVYICYVVHISDLEQFKVNMEPIKFLKYRDKAIKGNPNVPKNYYSSFELKYITFDELDKIVSNQICRIQIPLSYRLKRILRYGPLANKIYNFTNHNLKNSDI